MSEEEEEGARVPSLSLRGIGKSFLGTRVLGDIDLDVLPGEVHAVVGENGAGKSTLMKIIAGAYQPDEGTIELDGEPVRFAHPRAAQERGISIIYQEFNLLVDRSVAQNIFLGREPRHGPVIDGRAMTERTGELLDQLGVAGSISPRAQIRDLSVAEQQLVEVAKALSRDARILIMDEPTASLSPPEAEALFANIALLRDRGLSVLYISHRLKEVFDLAQRVTVLKDGRRVGTTGIAEVTPGTLVRMMVGRELTRYFPPRAAPADIGDVRLRVRDGAGGMLSGINLEVRAGEIVGIAGLAGSGRTELAQALFGVTPFQQGTVEVNGKAVRVRTPRRAIDLGLGFLTENRKAEGLVLPRSVTENTSLALRSLPGRTRRRRRVGRGGVAGLVAALAERVDLRGAGPDQEVQYLSGGNQQKVVLAKWLAIQADVLLFDEPTRGIDVGAKAGIHELMRELARSGKAILMISSELQEVIGMSDRILVMRHGTIAGELPAGPTEADMMLLATGESEAHPHEGAAAAAPTGGEA